MRRAVPKLVAVLVLLLAAALWPHTTKAPPMPAVDLAPSPVDDNLVPRALDRWFTFAAAQTTTTTTVAPRPSSSAPTDESQFEAHFDPGSVQQIIVDIFGDAAPAALHVARCESGYRADARNGQYRGVFQIGELHAGDWLAVIGRPFGESWMDPWANVAYAHALYLRSGWGPWECKP